MILMDDHKELALKPGSKPLELLLFWYGQRNPVEVIDGTGI